MSRSVVPWIVLLLALSFLLINPAAAFAPIPYPGETLVSTSSSTDNLMLELDGTLVQSWNGVLRPTSFAYYLGDGSILRPGQVDSPSFNGAGAGGRLQIIDSSDTVEWDYLFLSPDYQQHHDIQPMPNGNVLVISWERRSYAEAIQAGRQNISGEMWPLLITEITPSGPTGGNIVWEWRAWDHLIQDADPSKDNYGVVADHPELIDVNYGAVRAPSGDWIHANSVDYDPVYDQIVFSSRKFNEFFIIDHSTTTGEAAGHTGGNSGMGGDFLYRWGNPETYGRGTETDKYYFAIHGANFIDEGRPGAGSILTFNNGDRAGFADDYSTVAEIKPPRNPDGTYSIASGQPFGPAAPIWTYGDPGVFYGGPTHCGAQRLPNGNTLVTQSLGGRIFEVSEGGTVVWDYTHPGGVHRALRYATTTTAAPRRPGYLTRGLIEFLPAHPQPFTVGTTLRLAVAGGHELDLTVQILDVTGRRVALLHRGHHGPGELQIPWNGRDDSGRIVATGVYFAHVQAGTFSASQQLVRVK